MPFPLHRITIIFALAAGLAAAPALAAPAPAPATSAAQPMGALYGCADLKDAAQRLACFDKEVATLRSAEAAGNFKAVDRQAVEQLEKESFGFQLPSLPRLAFPKMGGDKPAPSAQTYEITAVRGGERPSYVMADGSVWRQIETERNIHVKKGATVVIEKAAMGSFMLSPTKGGGRGLRVRREQ
jgi:hypothetical protein